MNEYLIKRWSPSSSREWHGLPWGFSGQPVPVPVRTRTRTQGSGFDTYGSWGGYNPRVSKPIWDRNAGSRVYHKGGYLMYTRQHPSHHPSHRRLVNSKTLIQDVNFEMHTFDLASRVSCEVAQLVSKDLYDRSNSVHTISSAISIHSSCHPAFLKYRSL